MKDVRVRFAPSPTGALHIGGVRTALYNYLLARQQNGVMILRIEDTDQSRFVPGAEDYILKSLEWVGIKIDEGVGVGGPYVPYRQSERKELYQLHVKSLLESSHAYYAFDSEEELEAMRQRLKESGSTSQQYDAKSRLEMRNSLSLSQSELETLIKMGTPHVVRFKMPENQEVLLHDLIRGEVVVNTSQLDDKVLMKSDGMPTYHLANVVDDYAMKISHVIRGEEWLPSAPLHVLLYKAFGWESEMPQFAHLPLLLKPDGNGKLSKRDADRMGFPIFPLNWADPASGEMSKGFKESGYLPEAMVNFLAFLGWNPGTEQEIFSMKQLIEEFDIKRIGKAGARFDINKATWYNQHYIRQMPSEILAEMLGQQLDKLLIETKGEAYLISAVELVRDRISFPSDLAKETEMLFLAPTSFDSEIVSKKWNAEAKRALEKLMETLPGLAVFRSDEIRDSINASLDNIGIKPGKVMQVIRLALTGQGSGPDLMKTFEILGCSESVIRLKKAITTLPSIE